MTEQLKHWDKRIKELMEQVGYPNSMSLYQAFKQFQNELTTSQPAQAGEVDERVAFEAWARQRGFQSDELDRCRIGIVGPRYYNANTEMAWEAWQARASLPTQPAAQATPDDSFVAISFRIDDISPEPTEDFEHINCQFNGIDGTAEARRVDDNTVDIGRVVAFAQATHEPVPADQAKWCEYVAGMVDCWVSAERSNYHHKDEDLRVKAIAGIIERRLWALNKQPATPPQQAAGGPVGEVDQIDIDEDGQAHAWVVLHENVTIGDKLYTHPAPGVPDGFALVPVADIQALAKRAHELRDRQYDVSGSALLGDDKVKNFREQQPLVYAVACEVGAGLFCLADDLDKLAAAQAKGADK